MKTTAFGPISFFVAILVGCAMGCSQNKTTTHGNGGAGQGGASSGGGVSGRGGATGNSGVTGTGGATSAGGATKTGGSSGSGGTTANGGTQASGGTASGGSAATGGASGKQDGAAGAGGATGTGGADGGKDAAPGTGGTTSTGGATGSGGTTGAGGSTSTCPAFTAPAVSSLSSISELPDPFKFMSGTRMASKDDWPCRRQELSTLIQAFEYGAYPPKPDSVSGTLSDTSLTVQVEYGGKSITFTPTVTLPSGSGPFPVYIGLSGEGYDAPFPASLVTPMGIAHISYNTDDLANDYQGKGGSFYTLYGTSVTAGVLMAWA